MRHQTPDSNFAADLEALAEDYRRTLGRPVATLAEAAKLTGRSISALRQSLYRGDLVGSRAGFAARQKPASAAREK